MLDSVSVELDSVLNGVGFCLSGVVFCKVILEFVEWCWIFFTVVLYYLQSGVVFSSKCVVFCVNWCCKSSVAV